MSAADSPALREALDDARPAVLVVDDRPEALVSAFENADFRLVPCRDVRDALRLAHDHDFAAIVLDGRGGYETAGLLRQEERHRHTPILFLTAGDPGSVEMAVAYSLGAVDFLRKPVHLDALRAKLGLFVELRRQNLRHRREAEDALRAGRALSSSAIESTGALVFAKDADGRYLLANAAFASFFGKPQTEIIGRFDRDLFPPAIAEQLRENDRRIMEQGRSITFEERVPGLKGVRVYHLCTKSPLLGPDGRICGVIGVAQDVTPLKASEDAASRLAAIVESSADAILSESLDGEILTWNRAAERMFGYAAEEVIGRPSSLLVPPDRRGELGPALDRARDGQSTLFPETVRLRKGGILFWAQVSVSPIKDRVGAVAGLSTTVRDVSEARRMREAKEDAERATLRSRETLQKILDGALSAWITIDGRGRITAWNPQAERTFGWRRDEVIGKTLSQTIIPERLREAHENGLRRLAEGGPPQVMDRRLELPARKADGTEIPVELTISPVHGEDGTAYSAFLRDLTAVKRAEARLRLQYAVTRILSEADSLEEAAGDLLREMGEVVGWDVGVLWRMDEDYKVLRCRALWHRPDAPVPHFGKATRERTFAAGEGLPG
ncbi:MAG TPA: PAS domain S-box protein, partial [Planctomycetota bacterium]|nr:PAS domain S-box protein [Planctomycetota bacterium]